MNWVLGSVDYLLTFATTWQPWLAEHAILLLMGAAIVIQWIGFQALLIHYHLFRTRVKKKKPDTNRVHQLEALVDFQNTRIEQIFEKYAALKKEMNGLEKESIRRESFTPVQSTESVEASFMSMGEINLKKRLESLKRSQ
ncbi:MAG: hypothetical protein EA369_10330 [Bradymonadales bacterium]|nr:MAG: hypothetical protein EA369_10330 [Bradymonadales bacterium]